MTTNLNALASQALNLFPADRIDLAERLLESVDYFADPQIEDHWRDIGLRRLAEYERGEVSGIPVDTVHRQIWETLNEARLPS